jgi:hypothetical protein
MKSGTFGIPLRGHRPEGALDGRNSAISIPKLPIFGETKLASIGPKTVDYIAVYSSSRCGIIYRGLYRPAFCPL